MVLLAAYTKKTFLQASLNKLPILSSLTHALNGIPHMPAVSMCSGHPSHFLRYFSWESLPGYSNQMAESRSNKFLDSTMRFTPIATWNDWFVESRSYV